MATAFDRQDIVDAIDELVDLLIADDVSANIRIVGGAAIAIFHGRELTTTDIDAVYGRSEAVDRAVEAIATRHGWPDSWFNDKVQAFLSPFDEQADWVTFVERGDVEVRVASAHLLLAMKLRAARGQRDAGDIDLLLSASGVGSVAEAVDLYERYYPEDELKERALRQLQARLPEA